MNQSQSRNVSESVKQRLKNLAAKRGQDINTLFQYYVMERFLCRVSMSPNAHFLILKGALMLRVLGGPLSRATQDIDFQMQSPMQKPTCLTEDFWTASGKERRWEAFLKNAEIKLNLTLEQIIKRIDFFLMPVCDSIQNASDTNRLWHPKGPWV